MKNLLVIITLVFSVSVFAEVKPEWSIVPNNCGDNHSPVATINSPVEVCTASVTGHRDLEVVIFMYEKKRTSAKYFLVTNRTMRTGGNTIELEEISVMFGGRYAYVNDFIDGGETRELTEYFGFAGMLLQGGDVSATMFPVYTTQSLY